MTLPILLLGLLGMACAGLGALGGIGGATILVPVLLILGVDPLLAAPLGMLTVGAGSIAAASRQLDEGLVHHRLGLTMELLAAFGTVLGALASTRVPEQWLARVLGGAAMLGAVAAITRKGMRNQPISILDHESPGEWPGTLAGQYSLRGKMVPYQAHRVPVGLSLSGVAGVISGLAGVGGSFMKTPIMSEVMKVPVKVSAATATFTSGITAAIALIVYSGQGRIDTRSGSAVVLGALLGGTLGAKAQVRMDAAVARRVTGALLIVISLIVIGRSL